MRKREREREKKKRRRRRRRGEKEREKRGTGIGTVLYGTVSLATPPHMRLRAAYLRSPVSYS